MRSNGDDSDEYYRNNYIHKIIFTYRQEKSNKEIGNERYKKKCLKC